MADTTQDEKPQVDDTTTPDSSKGNQTEPAHGKTPETTEDLKTLKERVEKNEVKATSLEKALKEERAKRKELQELLNSKTQAQEPSDDLSEFSQEEIANFERVARAKGVVFKKDLEEAKEREKIEEQRTNNASVYKSFLDKYQDVFGSEETSTPEQDRAWKAFSSYLADTYDLDRGSILTVKNLDKKLKAAIRTFSKESDIEALKRRAKDEALAERSNADLLAVGGGGKARSEDGWNRKISKAEAEAGLLRAGYSKAEVKEMLSSNK